MFDFLHRWRSVSPQTHFSAPPAFAPSLGANLTIGEIHFWPRTTQTATRRPQAQCPRENLKESGRKRSGRSLRYARATSPRVPSLTPSRARAQANLAVWPPPRAFKSSHRPMTKFAAQAGERSKTGRTARSAPRCAPAQGGPGAPTQTSAVSGLPAPGPQRTADWGKKQSADGLPFGAHCPWRLTKPSPRGTCAAHDMGLGGGPGRSRPAARSPLLGGGGGVVQRLRAQPLHVANLRVELAQIHVVAHRDLEIVVNEV